MNGVDEKKMSRKKRFWQKYAGVAFMMLIGAICGVVIAEFSADSASGSLGSGLISLAALFAGMYLAIMFHIIIHEAGHLLFGLLTGYSFVSFRVFSFMWVKDGGEVRLKRLSIAGTGGQCLMDPPDMKDAKFPQALYNMGGSIVNLAAGGIFLTAHFLLGGVPFMKAAMLIFAVVGFMLAVMNGVPMRMGAVDNDGYNAISLSKSPQAAKAFWIQLKANAQVAKGIRLREMPDEWFAVPPDEGMKNSMIAARGVFAANRLMDEEKYDEAKKLIAHLLQIESGMAGLHRSLLIGDWIFCELIGENRAEAIERMLTKEQRKFMMAMKKFPSVLRTEYALALIHEKNASKAQKILSEFEKCAESYPYPVETASERELIALAERKGKENAETDA